MRFIGISGLTVLAGLAAASGTAAADVTWDAFVAQMSEYDDTIALSEQFAALLSDGDAEGIGRLADEVGKSLGDRHTRLVYQGYQVDQEPGQDGVAYLDALIAHVATLDVFPDDAAASEALQNLGSCEMAGVLLRNLVLQVAGGDAEYRLEDGRIFIDGTSNDRAYAEMLARCQLLERHDRVPAAVGYSHLACLPSSDQDCPEIADQ